PSIIRFDTSFPVVRYPTGGPPVGWALLYKSAHPTRTDPGQAVRVQTDRDRLARLNIVSETGDSIQPVHDPGHADHQPGVVTSAQHGQHLRLRSGISQTYPHRPQPEPNRPVRN